MSAPVTRTIELLEQELEATHQRAGELQRAIDTLRPLAGDMDLTDAELSAPGKQKRMKKTKPVRRRPGGRNGVAQEFRDQILVALKKSGPCGPGELAQALGWDRAILGYRVRPLIKAKQVQATGSTTNRLLLLPGQKPAKEDL